MINQNVRMNPDKYWDLLNIEEKLELIRDQIKELYNLHDAVDEDITKIEKRLNSK